MPGTLEFKFEFSYTKIEFLDLEISIEDGRLKTNLYIKPTNKQLYLEFDSNHPSHCKESIPYSQALRVVERCATPSDTEVQLTNLKEKLLQRKYPEEVVDKKIELARKKDRRKLIFGKRNKTQGREKVRLIFTHNKVNPPLQMWIRQSKKLLIKNSNSNCK